MDIILVDQVFKVKKEVLLNIRYIYFQFGKGLDRFGSVGFGSVGKIFGSVRFAQVVRFGSLGKFFGSVRFAQVVRFGSVQ